MRPLGIPCYKKTQFLCNSRLESTHRTTRVIKIAIVIKDFRNQFFVLSNTEDNTLGSLNRGGMTDFVLSITLFAIRQKSLEPGFWELIHCIVSLV